MKTSNCAGCQYYNNCGIGNEFCMRLKDISRTKGEYELYEDCYIMRKGWDCFVRINDVSVCSLSLKSHQHTCILDW